MPGYQTFLKKYPAADAHVAHGMVALDGKAPAPIALPALTAGGYRVRLSGGGEYASSAFPDVRRRGSVVSGSA